MSYNVLSIDPFDRKFKRLVKKYPSLGSDLAELARQLSVNPALGFPLGHNCFKVRLAISSKSKGKSGGARVITYFYVRAKKVYLLSIYDKSEQEDISDAELRELLQYIPEE